MSSNCPPQLHLELPPNTTSFKRSFDQFGFDLESPLGASDGAGASSSDGNDRNKRARSASSFSDDDRSIGSSSSSTLASGSSPISGDSSTHDSIGSHLSAAPRLAVPHLSLNIGRSPLEPPRLPTPEIQDIDMTDYPLPEPEEAEVNPASQADSINLNPVVSTSSQAEENYRLSLERFNAFDTQIAALRRSRSPSLPRSLTPPPILPPLELLGEEVPINTNTISFLHPPAQPSPPLPHSLYNYGPSRNQLPGSRTTSRNDPLLDDLRRLPHETHTQRSPLAESSTASRDFTDDDDSRTDEEWNRITQNVRSARGDGLYRQGTPWSFWPAVEERADDDNENEGDEEEEEEVQEVLEQPSTGEIWSSPIPPTLGELRSSSPLFNPLDDLEPQPPPAPVPAPALLPRRADENAAPPTLPPIEDQVLSQTWDIPMEEVLDTVWNRYPSDRMPQSTAQPQYHQRYTQPPPRITIPSGLRGRDFERERTPAQENVSASATTGSASDIASPAPAHAHAHAALSPFGGWLGHEEPWYFRATEEESGPLGQASRSSTNTNTNITTTATTTTSATASSYSASNSNNSNEASSSTSAAVGSSILDTYAASRLQALQGIGTALEGIGQVLRESELTLAPYLRDGNNGSSMNTNNVIESTVNAMEGERSSRANRSPSVRSNTEGRTSAWRSTSAVGNEEGRRQRVREATVRETARASASGVSPSNIDFDWLMSDEADDAPENNTTSFRDMMMARLARRLPSTTTTESLETLRQRAVALEASVRDMDERFIPDRSVGTSGDGQMGAERSGSPQPLARLFEPVELFPSSWGDNAPATSSRRDRELPTNTSMLFDDGPSTVAFANNSQSSTSTTDRSFGSGWRTMEPVIPRVREPPSQSPERERENERERMRLFERSWIRASHTSSGASSLFTGTSLSNLRARPYVSQSSTHAHGHSYSQSHSSSSYAPLLSGGATESAADAQRRIARLGLIQMQRQRANSGRMPSASSASEMFAAREQTSRPLPLRPRGFDSFPPRSSSPDRHSFRARLVEQRARFDGLRESDRTSSLYDAAMDTLDLFNIARPSRNTGEASPERPHPPPGLRFVRRSFDRPGESASSDPSSTSSGLNSRRSRFPTPEHLDRTVREPLAEFLPVPSLPSPSLEFEFAPPPSATNDSGASEPHNDHRNFTIHPSRPEVSYPASVRRPPSPVFHRRVERSPSRRSPPPGLPREFDPDTFAPGPFRNTIQSFWAARNNRPGTRPRDSPTRQAPQAQPQPLVMPPSLPPLAFEEHRPSSQRPGRSSGDFSSLYRNESDEASTAHLRAFLSRHPLPPPDRPPTPQRFGDFLNQLDSPLDVLDRILTPQNNTQTTLTPTDVSSENRGMFDTPSSWPLDGENVSLRRPSASSYRPPWRALHPPRPPPNPPSDLHNFLNRHPRTEAIRREVSRRQPPLRGTEDGFNHVIEALRNDGPSTARSQEFSNRFQRDTSREPRTWASASPWGILEQSQGNGPSRQMNTRNDQSNVEPSVFQRRRRHIPLTDPFHSFQADIDDDDIEVVSLLHDRPRFLTRRFRGPGGEAPVFPRRIPTFMRSTSGATRRGSRPLGDYMRDEDWNGDYESLLSLAAQLGEVKPRSTPAEIIDSLETGLYKDWKTPDSDHRCPICLDDYEPDDLVLKLSDCSHWLHSECLQQWLKGATTCPVCRETVLGPSHRTSSDPSNEAGSNEAGPSQRRGPRGGSGGSGESEGEGTSGAAGSSSGLSSLDPRRPRRFL